MPSVHSYRLEHQSAQTAYQRPVHLLGSRPRCACFPGWLEDLRRPSGIWSPPRNGEVSEHTARLTAVLVVHPFG
jgi:hypothetical protein